MATKFASIYKQELKSKGALSSMGSAVLKSARERTDIRNMLFGGKGMLSATGQKMFGRGYSALSSGAAGAPSAAQAAAQSVATSELISSNERQEALLRVVAKNTFNMNMMARDMNITRQNIATLTKLAAGKSAKAQDAMWYDVKTRNQSIDSLGRKTPTKAGGSTESKGSGIFGLLGGLFSGGANLLGAVVSGLLGTVGAIGGGILSTIGSVLRFIPGGFLIGTIALAGVAYLIKKVSENVDFSKLKNDILKGLGLDPDDKENTLTKQILMKLGFSEGTAGKIDKTFSDIGQTFSNIFEPVVSTMLIHSKAAFNTLVRSFSIMTEELMYQTDKFFNENKGKILAAIALGYMGPAVLFSPVLASGIVAMAGAFGSKTARTMENITEELDTAKRTQDKDLMDLIPERSLRDRPEEAKANKLKELMDQYLKGEKFTGLQAMKKQAIIDAQGKIIELQAEIEAMRRAAAASELRQRQLGDLPGTLSEIYNQEIARQTGTDGSYERLEGVRLNRLSKPDTAPGTAPGTAPSQVKKGYLVHGRYPVTSPHGERVDPFDKTKMQMHRGADVALPVGHPLTAAVDGEVIGVGRSDIAGNFVSIRDADGNIYSYSHLNEIKVIKGATVKRGAVIGFSGKTGRALGPHLHFDVKDKKGNYRSPTEEELRNAISVSEKITQLTFDNQNLRASMLPDTGGGTTIIAPQNTTVAPGGASQVFASVIDAEAMYLFTSRIG